MTSATIIHLALGTRNHQSQRTTKIKLKAATKFQLWTMKFDSYIIFIKYCSGFQILNPVPLNHLQYRSFLLQHRCFLWSLSAAAAGEKVAFLAIKSMLDSLWKECFQLFKLSGKMASSFIQMTLSSHCFLILSLFFFVCLFY